MERVIITRPFARWLSRSGLRPAELRAATIEMTAGLIDVDLGGGVYKKRIALPGGGKRGGARVLIATRFKHRWFFIYGFNKSDSSNITKAELKGLKALSLELLSLDELELAGALASGVLIEVK